MRIDHFHFVPFTALKFVGVCSKHLRKSTEIFGNLLKTSEMSGLPTKFEEPSEIFEKWLEIFGKFPKTAQCTTSFPGSLILPPGASEERPWHTLVTCHFDN